MRAAIINIEQRYRNNRRVRILLFDSTNYIFRYTKILLAV